MPITANFAPSPSGRPRSAAATRPSARARGREHPHHARGGRRVRAAGHALLDRQGLVGAAAPGAEGVLSRADSLPAAARRHDLQVPRDDRVPRPLHEGDRRAAHRPHQRGGDRRRHAAVPGRHTALLRAAEDASRCSTRSKPATSTRRSAAPGATRSARAPRSASSRCATPRASGIRSASGPSCGTC